MATEDNNLDYDTEHCIRENHPGGIGRLKIVPDRKARREGSQAANPGHSRLEGADVLLDEEGDCISRLG